MQISWYDSREKILNRPKKSRPTSQRATNPEFCNYFYGKNKVLDPKIQFVIMRIFNKRKYA